MYVCIPSLRWAYYYKDHLSTGAKRLQWAHILLCLCIRITCVQGLISYPHLHYDSRPSEDKKLVCVSQNFNLRVLFSTSSHCIFNNTVQYLGDYTDICIHVPEPSTVEFLLSFCVLPHVHDPSYVERRRGVVRTESHTVAARDLLSIDENMGVEFSLSLHSLGFANPLNFGLYMYIASKRQSLIQ